MRITAKQRQQERADTRAYVLHLVERGYARVAFDPPVMHVLGKTSDGTEVSLGYLDSFGIDSLGSYLRKFPYPNQW